MAVSIEYIRLEICWLNSSDDDQRIMIDIHIPVSLYYYKYKQQFSLHLSYTLNSFIISHK